MLFTKGHFGEVEKHRLLSIALQISNLCPAVELQLGTERKSSRNLGCCANGSFQIESSLIKLTHLAICTDPKSKREN